MPLFLKNDWSYMGFELESFAVEKQVYLRFPRLLLDDVNWKDGRSSRKKRSCERSRCPLINTTDCCYQNCNSNYIEEFDQLRICLTKCSHFYGKVLFPNRKNIQTRKGNISKLTEAQALFQQTDMRTGSWLLRDETKEEFSSTIIRLSFKISFAVLFY